MALFSPNNCAVFPLVVKRRRCLPQLKLDPLNRGRSIAVVWPYFWSSSLYTGTGSCMDFPSYWPSTWSTVLVYKPRILSCTVHVLLYRYILILYWFYRSLAVVVDWLSTACWLHDWLLARNWFARICMVVCRPHTAQHKFGGRIGGTRRQNGGKPCLQIT